VRGEPEHPTKPDDTSDNARSIGFLLTCGGFKFADFGDLTWNVEHKLVCPTKPDRNRRRVPGLPSRAGHQQQPGAAQGRQPDRRGHQQRRQEGRHSGAFKWLKETPSIKDIFQLHRNVATGPGENTAPELTANDDLECKGDGVVLTGGPVGEELHRRSPLEEDEEDVFREVTWSPP
jgi:hypothetical protein